MEQSMAHHRDPNIPRHLNAASICDFERDEEVIALNESIAELTKQIGKQPDTHKSLALERCRLYSKKAKKLEVKRSEFVKEWWDASYDEYIAGNDFTEYDATCLFDIYRKYMPQRSRLRDSLFRKMSLDCDEGRQCLEDMVALCTSTERVAYYPGMTPEDGRCFECKKQMSRFGYFSHD
jgi:hypothetical protein